MKILLDACVWGGTRKYLEASGHDVVWAGDWPEDPGDEEILSLYKKALASSLWIQEMSQKGH